MHRTSKDIYKHELDSLGTTRGSKSVPSDLYLIPSSK